MQHATALVGEPQRCIHVGDRESDIYELYGTTLISTLLAHAPVKGHYCLQVTDQQGKRREAKLEIKFLPLVVHPPQYKKRAYPAL